jgi:hypothetical protein
VLSKGKPDDAWPDVVAGRQVPLPDTLTSLSGMLTGGGAKVSEASKSHWVQKKAVNRCQYAISSEQLVRMVAMGPWLRHVIRPG